MLLRVAYAFETPNIGMFGECVEAGKGLLPLKQCFAVSMAVFVWLLEFTILTSNFICTLVVFAF